MSIKKEYPDIAEKQYLFYCPQRPNFASLYNEKYKMLLQISPDVEREMRVERKKG